MEILPLDVGNRRKPVEGKPGSRLAAAHRPVILASRFMRIGKPAHERARSTRAQPGTRIAERRERDVGRAPAGHRSRLEALSAFNRRSP
jgi:hypothetical protein